MKKLLKKSGNTGTRHSSCDTAGDWMDPIFSTAFYTLLAWVLGAIVFKIAEYLPRGSALWLFVTVIGWIYVALVGVGLFLIAFFRLREALFGIPVPA